MHSVSPAKSDCAPGSQPGILARGGRASDTHSAWLGAGLASGPIIAGIVHIQTQGAEDLQSKHRT